MAQDLVFVMVYVAS